MISDANDTRRRIPEGPAERNPDEAVQFWLTAIVQFPNEAITGKTLDGTVTSWNQAAAGAHGYALKGADGAQTLRAIHAVADGEAIFGPEITRRLTAYLAAPEWDHQTNHPFSNLTEREHEILALMAQGLTNTAIASRLYLSPKTVRNYVSSIFTKLHVADRPQAIVRAREAGLGKEAR